MDKISITSESTEQLHPPISKIIEIYILIFGVLLPVITLGVEITMMLCGGIFFDPIPTIWHILLILTVSITNFLFYIRKRFVPNFLNGLKFLIGISLGVSLFYSLLFIALIPVGIILIIYLGIGFLILSPLLSFISTLFCLAHIKKINFLSRKKLNSFWLGFLLSLTFILGLEVPPTITKIGMQMATSEFPEKREQGIKLLRKFGDKEVLLKSCYETTGLMFRILNLKNITPDKSRQIYYKVTGKAFNTIPLPESLRKNFRVWDEFSFDQDQGSENVGNTLKDLSLASSKIDGIIDTDSAISYFEWTMVFKNNSKIQNEARTVINLPPDSVISRATLWVNGEEREAAFAEKSLVREAYNKVVMAKRDPLLVTQIGSQNALIQCFPVPPNGEMKIKIGISAPVKMENKKQGLIFLPFIKEKNFLTQNNFNHLFWLDSKKPVRFSQKFFELNSSNGIYTLKGKLENNNLKKPIMINFNKDISSSWTKDPVDKNFIIYQNSFTEKTIPAKRIVLIIDGSTNMKEYIKDITDSIKKIPPDTEVKALLASDEIIELTNGFEKLNETNLSEISSKIIQNNFYGGFDNISALLKSFERTNIDENTFWVWLHGPQPDVFSFSNLSFQELEQIFERQGHNLNFYEMQFGNGDNNTILRLNKNFEIKSISAYYENEKIALEEFFSNLSGKKEKISFYRERKKFNSLILNESTEASSHLARIWANDKIYDLLKTDTPINHDSALKLAITYHLITPVSGAVVLETQEQYNNAGLKPVKHSEVPIIPEPETWMLIIIAVFSAIWLFYQKRKSCQAT